MLLAPIVIFCYNRPGHLTQTLNALKTNVLAKESQLYIFCDGAKSNASEVDIKNINEVATICNGLKGFADVTVIKALSNKGLQASVIGGLNFILEKFENVIVVEDDVVTSPYFLQFMNDALVEYKYQKKVLTIGSWNYYYKTEHNFFNHMPDTIAWATWSDRWKLFEPDGKKLYDQLIERRLMNKFNLGGKYNFENMLKLQYEDRISSWAIRWTAVAVLNDTLTLYPKVSLSQHIGFDTAATNSNEMDYNKDLVLAQTNISYFNIEIKEDPASVAGFLYVENEIKKSLSYIKKENPLSVQKIKNTILKYIPYTLKQGIKKIIRKEAEHQVSGWFGKYSSWLEVEKQCGGYDDKLVFEKVKQATLMVKNGEAVYERDSVTFDKIEYDQNILSFFETSIKNNELNIIDFGGSLGSVYFQYKHLLNGKGIINWNVIEQKHFVEFGKNEIENNELHFYYTINDCLTKNNIQILLLSSVLSYIEKPYDLLHELMDLSFKYIIIDRNLFLKDENRLTKQIVPSSIYKASYPCWILSEKEILETLSSKYEVLCNLNPYGDLKIDLIDKEAYFKGFILKLK